MAIWPGKLNLLIKNQALIHCTVEKVSHSLRNTQFRKRRIHVPKINILTKCMNMKLYNQRLFYERVCVVEVVSQVGASIFS